MLIMIEGFCKVEKDENYSFLHVHILYDFIINFFSQCYI